MLFKLIEMFNTNFLKQNTMKTFIVSYLSKSEMIVLNQVINADSRIDAIAEVKEDALVILSTVTIK